MTRIVIIILLLTTVAFSQSIVPVGRPSTGERRRNEGTRDEEKPVEPKTEREIFRGTLSKNAKKLIEPDPSIRKQYAAFLKKPDTGIVKLLDVICSGIGVVEFPKACDAGIPGNGGHYSLREREYFYPGLSDAILKDGRLYTSGFLVQGLIVSLGEVPIEELSLTSKGIHHLSAFVPAESSQQAHTQRLQLESGLRMGEHVYYRSVQLKKDHSYAIRLIAYRSRAKTLSVDSRVDMIAVLKVVAIDPDGSVTFVWRQLQKRDAPNLRDQS